ncbi:MAG: hypothetical protein IK132_01315 [Clostridia bacterium]|nr:hypothetical protein [Clostridia bacterium]
MHQTKRMKKFIRPLCLLLALLLLLPYGCGKKNAAQTEGKHGGQNASAETPDDELIFRGVPINPEGPIVDPLIRPYVDPDGNFIIAALEGEQEDGTRGTVRLERNKDGEWELLPDSYRPYLLPEGTGPERGMLTEDGAVFLMWEAGVNAVALMDADYACTASVPVSRILPDVSYPCKISVSGDGTIWVTSQGAYAALEPDLTVRFAERSDMPIEAVAADDESGAWLLSGSQVLCMNRNGQHVSTVRIDEPIDTSMGALYCFDGVLYVSVSRGLIAYREGEWSLAVDYAAADITRTFTFPYAFLEDGEMILSLFNGKDRQILWDYRYVPKPDDSEGPILLEIVTEYGLGPTAFSTLVANFNRSQDRIRVTMTKMSDLYGNDRDHMEEAFGRDLVTGVRRPDMVYDVSDRILNAIAQHSLYVDLSSYLSSDDDINFDNLFGGARKTVTYKDTIWGMPLVVYFHTLTGLNSVLGEYAGRTSWTIAEEMAFIESLPEDVEVNDGQRQCFVPQALTYYEDLRVFVDMETMSCRFTSPEAVAFLEYLASRPATYEEELRFSKIFAAWHTSAAEVMRLYHDGKVALNEFTFHDVREYYAKYQCFFSEDITMIGYPTEDPDGGYGGYVTDLVSYGAGACTGALTIMRDSAYPEACWEFIKYAVRHNNPVSILKDEFEKYIEECDGREFAYYDDGTRGDGYTDRRKAAPGLHMTFHKEDAEELWNILEYAGRPWLVGFDDSLTEIVTEELSALTAKHVTPEECAERLQSRVSLWLAERS